MSETHREKQVELRQRLRKSLDVLENAKSQKNITKSDEAAVDNFIRKAQSAIATIDKEL